MTSRTHSASGVVVSRYGEAVSASPSETPTSDGGTEKPSHPLAPGASPWHIRSALLLEDRAAFETAYGAALDTAREALNLAPVFEVLEQWRRVALLQADPDRFARVARRAAELRTGAPVPADEPLDVTRVKAGMTV